MGGCGAAVEPCGTHAGLQVEPLGPRVGPIPLPQRDLHLPQEEVPTQRVVVPHGQIQRPTPQLRLPHVVLRGGGGGSSGVTGRGGARRSAGPPPGPITHLQGLVKDGVQTPLPNRGLALAAVGLIGQQVGLDVPAANGGGAVVGGGGHTQRVAVPPPVPHSRVGALPLRLGQLPAPHHVHPQLLRRRFVTQRELHAAPHRHPAQLRVAVEAQQTAARLRGGGEKGGSGRGYGALGVPTDPRPKGVGARRTVEELRLEMEELLLSAAHGGERPSCGDVRPAGGGSVPWGGMERGPPGGGVGGGAHP